jgi:NADH-quinone oxidoreductase subunit E
MTAQNMKGSKQNSGQVSPKDNGEELGARGFSFTKQNLEESKKILARYPEDRKNSAILPLMTMAQNQNGGWLSVEAIEYVAELTHMSYLQAYEVASFYSMFHLSPVGKCHIQVCGTTPCWLKGAEEVKNSLLEELGVKEGEVTSDNMFCVTEVECLGACVNAPVFQVNNEEYYEDLTPDKIKTLLSELRAKKSSA